MRHFLMLFLAVGAAAACRGGDGATGHEKHEQGERHDEHATDSSVVRIDPAAITRNQIALETVEEQVLVGGVDLPAEIQVDPARTAHVTPLLRGQLTKVKASIGDRVEREDVLAEVQSAELGEARGAIAQAAARAEAARSEFERQEMLRKEGIGADKNLVEARAELRRAEAELRASRGRLRVYGRGGTGARTFLRSPIDGQVVERHATAGEVVGPDSALFMIADLSRVWVVGRVYPQQVRAAVLGAPVKLTLDAYPAQSWTGKLDYVAPRLDEDTRTLLVRTVLDNPKGVLRPGLFGTLSLPPAGGGKEAVPTIDAAAVQEIDGTHRVFVPAGEEGEYRAAVVTLGASSDDRVEVTSGLAPGDEYVSSGAFVLKSELLRSQLGEGHAH